MKPSANESFPLMTFFALKAEGAPPRLYIIKCILIKLMMLLTLGSTKTRVSFIRTCIFFVHPIMMKSTEYSLYLGSFCPLSIYNMYKYMEMNFFFLFSPNCKRAEFTNRSLFTLVFPWTMSVDRYKIWIKFVFMCIV